MLCYSNGTDNYFYYIGDQFIEPYGFSGSLPLLFAMFWLLFVLIAENKLLVGWLDRRTRRSCRSLTLTLTLAMPQYVVCPSVSPSVRPSVTCTYRGHTGWNTSKIISRLISLVSAWADPDIGDLVQRERHEIRSEYRGGVMSTKTCNISETMQDSADSMIVAWVILTWYQPVTDRQTDWPMDGCAIASTVLWIASYADAL